MSGRLLVAAWVFGAVLAALALQATSAKAQVRVDAFGGGRFAGTTTLSSQAPTDDSAGLELGTAFEAGLGAEYTRFDWVAIGGRLAFLGWDTSLPSADRDPGMTYAVTLTFLPKVRANFGPLEIYGGIGAGLTVAFFPSLDGAEELGTGDGFHFDFVAGARVQLGELLSLFIEGGWSTHSFADRIPVDIPDVGMMNVPVEVRSDQPLARAGLGLTL